MRRRGRAFDDYEIDDAIDEWHASAAGSAEDVSLHAYLGWGWEEYRAWVLDPGSLSIIVLRGESR